MNTHQKTSWYVCSVLGALTALLYMIIIISVLCIDIAEGFGLVIPPSGMQLEDYWVYLSRIFLSVSVMICYGVRYGIERAVYAPRKISCRLMMAGLFALILTFIEIA